MMKKNAVKATGLLLAMTIAVGSAAGGVSAASRKALSRADAKSIALSEAKVNESDVSRLVIEKETDDGQRIYEVSFRSGQYKLEYNIDAYTGEILDMDKEKIVTKKSRKNKQTSWNKKSQKQSSKKYWDDDDWDDDDDDWDDDDD